MLIAKIPGGKLVSALETVCNVESYKLSWLPGSCSSYKDTAG